MWKKGRLGPGQMFAVDLETHEVLKNWEIKERVAHQAPYGDWLKQYRVELDTLPFEENQQLDTQGWMTLQTAFGYGLEDMEMVIADMASLGKEPTFCMGDDIPLAILSDKPHLLYDYFKQRFAQVTNPPIDPLRERVVMSLKMRLGERGNLLVPQAEDARMLKIQSPVLNEAELAKIQSVDGFASTTLSTLYPVDCGPDGLAEQVQQLCQQATDAVAAGHQIIILSDAPDGTLRERSLTAEQTYIPPLLAVGAVHHHLIKAGTRLKVSLVVETAQCWNTHHFACLIGYGASARLPLFGFRKCAPLVVTAQGSKSNGTG